MYKTYSTYRLRGQSVSKTNATNSRDLGWKMCLKQMLLIDLGGKCV